MATRLVQIITFTDVADAATVSLAHALNIDGVAQTPDFVAGDVAGFAVSADADEVTVTNNSGAQATIHVWIEKKHSIARQLGGGSLSPLPFVVTSGDSSGGGGGGGTVTVTTGSLAGDGSAEDPLGAHVFVWAVGTSWADQYAAMTAVPGPKICFIEYDHAVGERVITNDGTPQDWNDIYFWGLSGQGPGTSLFVRTESGLTLAGKSEFSRTVAYVRIRDLDLQFGSGAIFTPSGTGYIEFDVDGGRISSGTGATLVTGRTSVIARNRAVIAGYANGMFVCNDNGSRITIMSGATLTGIVFKGTGAQTVTIYNAGGAWVDASFTSVTKSLVNILVAANAAGLLYNLSIDGGGAVTATLRG